MSHHYFMFEPVWMKLARRLAYALFTPILVGSILTVLTLPPFAAVVTLPRSLLPVAVAQTPSNTVSGAVFQDYNGDGFRNQSATPDQPAVDAPVAGVMVRAYDSSGQEVGRAISSRDGSYTMTVTSNGPLRVEFATFPDGFTQGIASTASQSNAADPAWSATTAGASTQFILGDRATHVNLPLINAQNYCQANPDLVTNRFVLSKAILNTDTDGEPSLIDFPYTASGNTIYPRQVEIPQGVIGTTWGLAYQRSTRQIYAGAFFKRFAPFGFGGPGAIYRITREPAPGQATLFADLNVLFGPSTAGPDLHGFAPFRDYREDADTGLNTFDAVGKTALGGLAIAPDETKLYVMNLFDRQLYELPLDSTPTAANVRRVPVPLDQNTLPAQACPNPTTDIRPFAVEYHAGKLYVGMVCSGESAPASPEVATWTDSNGDGIWGDGEPYTDLNQNDRFDYKTPDTLAAYVYTVEPATLTFSSVPVLAFPLNYPISSIHAGVSGDWNPWEPRFTGLRGPSRYAFAQPLLTSLAFDNGNLLVGLRDRYSDQVAYRGIVLNPANEADVDISGGAGGDTLRACGDPTTGWTLENNATCGGVTTAGANTKEGPGGGEYYWGDSFSGHHETSLAGLLSLPGYSELVTTAWDPLQVNAQGVRWISHVNGQENRAYTIIPKSTLPAVGWGKGSGLGDLIALCDPAPLALGNRIWLDSNGNGVQDPNESGIEGVTVRLYYPGFGPDGIAGTADDQRAIALAVTDPLGEYTFVNGAAPDAIIDEIGVVTNTIRPGATYEIRLDKGGDYQADEPLFGLTLAEQHDATPSLSGSAQNDSDALYVTNPLGSAPGTFPVIVYTTGGAGASDYALDFGFVPAGVAIGNQVWFDTDNDGRVDGQEAGAAGVLVELFRDANGNGQIDGAEARTVMSTTTSSAGFYLFTLDANNRPLAPGAYAVGIAPSNFSTGVLLGYHSSGVAITNNGALSEAAPPLAATDLDNDDNGARQQEAFYAGGVLSSVLAVSNNEPEHEIPGNRPETLPGATPGLTDPTRNNTSNTTVDFGFYRVALGDRLFIDGANNGLRDEGDGGLNGVTLHLFAADGLTEIPVGADGLLGSADDSTSGVTSAGAPDGAGAYLFSGLAAGDYIVRLAPPATYLSSSGNSASQRSGPYEPAPDPDTTAGGKVINHDDNGAVSGGVIDSLPVTLVPGDPRLPNPADIDQNSGTTINRTVDFGFIIAIEPTQYSLGNRVWLDMGAGANTGNGHLDSDEGGIANLMVTLYALPGGVPTLLATTQTDRDGYYRFDNLAAGAYLIEVTPGTAFVASSNGQEVDPNLGQDQNQNCVDVAATGVRTRPITLGPDDSEPAGEADLGAGGQGATDLRSNMTVDCGFTTNNLVSIGNQLFIDRNQDARFDPGRETGVNGVLINLYYDLDNNGQLDETESATPYRSTTTTALGAVDGFYLFAGLLPGTYVVEVAVSNFAAQAPLDGYLSCSGQNGAATGPTEPAADPDDAAYDADMQDKGAAFFDAGRGVTTVRSLPITLQPNSEPLSRLSPDGDGISQNGILDPEEEPAFDNDLLTADGNENLVVDFCLFKPYSLGNRIWFDKNDNGALDSDEVGLAGVRLDLYTATDTLVATTTTNLQGYYRFDYLSAGEYTLQVAVPTSPVTTKPMRSSTDKGGDPDVQPQDGDDNCLLGAAPGLLRTPLLTLGDGAFSESEPTGEGDQNPLAAPSASDGRTNLTVDCGFFESVSLGSRVFNDAENKGYRVSGQLNGLEGAIVYLYNDRNLDNQPDGTAILSQTTNFAGDYLFTELRPGGYLVEVAPPPGFLSSSGRQGSALVGPYEGSAAPDPNVGPGGGYNNDDNGITRGDGRIFSRSILLTNREENALDSSLDPNTNRTLDFALYQPLSLGNLVWDDLNDNGLLDGAEVGIDGVTVNLYHDANFDGSVEGAELQTPVASTVTTQGGRYLFRYLGRGNYVVELAAANFTGAGVLADYHSSSDATAGVQGAYEPAPDPDDLVGPNNQAIDNDDNGQTAVATTGSTVQSKVVTLEAGKEPQNETLGNDPTTPDANANLTVDFGLYVPFSLGNRVWLDANNNGQIDGGEAGIGGVLVELYLTDGLTRTGSTVTDAQGYYRFDGLTAGDYMAEVSPYNFITDTEYANGVLLHYLSSTPDAGSPNADSDSRDDGVGRTPSSNTGIRSQPLTLGLGPLEPTQESDLAALPNAQGARDAFANMTLDFGFFTTACLGNRVWQDSNANGLQEATEPGLVGITVTLATTAGQVLAMQTTGADGHYQFCNLDPGQYVLQFTPLPGFVGSPQDRLGNETDSDTDPTGRTPVITLLSGAADEAWDAGFYQAPNALDESAEPLLYKIYLPAAAQQR